MDSHLIYPGLDINKTFSLAFSSSSGPQISSLVLMDNHHLAVP